jgi:two-component system, chemotaxis family, chemotaxis protein CheY
LQRLPGLAFAVSLFSGNLVAVDLSMPVLVVDDYATMIRIVSNLLRQLGFSNIDTAMNGESALELMSTRRYGLVLSDWNMEPMTGLDLVKAVRKDQALNDTPFIMVTAESKPENVVTAKLAGVDSYIVKPFNAETLKRKLSGVLGKF